MSDDRPTAAPRLRHVVVVMTTALAAAWLVVAYDVVARGARLAGSWTLLLPLVTVLSATAVAWATTRGNGRVSTLTRRCVVGSLVVMVVATSVALVGRTSWALALAAVPLAITLLSLLGAWWAEKGVEGDRAATREMQAGIAALAAVLLALGLGVASVFGAHGRPPLEHLTSTPRILVAALSAVAAVVVAAWHWSRRWFIGTVLAGTLVVLAVLVPEGARHEVERRRPEARSTATALFAEVTDLDAEIETAEQDLVSTAKASRSATVLVITVDGKGPTSTASCRPPEPAAGEGDGSDTVEGPADPGEQLCEALLAVYAANARRGLHADGSLDPEVDRAVEVSAELADAEETIDALVLDADLTPDQSEQVGLVDAAIRAATASWVLPSMRQATQAARQEVSTLCTDALGTVDPPGRGQDVPPDEARPTDEVTTCPKDTERTAIGEEANRRELDLTEASARRSVAAAAVALDGTTERKASLAAAEEAWVDAARRLETNEPQDVTDLVGDAAGDLVEGIALTGDSAVPAAFSSFAWALVAIIALVALRWLAQVNGDRGGVTLKIETVEGTDDDITAIFRRHILSNAKEPATLPGTAGAIGVTDILAKTDWAGELVGMVMSALQRIFAATASHTVLATHLEVADPGGDDPIHEMFVQLRSHRTGEVVARGTVRAGTKALVARDAGYWVAAQVLAIDTTTPSWAAWSGAASEALSVADAVSGGGPDERRAGLESLRVAAAKAPTSGIVLTRLANALDEAGETIEALEIELRAVICHPRYPVARYRLIASLSMVAGRLDDDDLSGDVVRWRRIDASLERLRLVTGYAGEGRILTPDGAPRATSEVKEALLDLALDLEPSASMVSWPEHCLVAALRRRERAYWLQYALRLDGWRRGVVMGALVRSIARSVIARKHGLRPEASDATRQDEAKRLALSRKDSLRWWQVAYTDACTLAIAADGGVTVRGVGSGVDETADVVRSPTSGYRDAAVELLERARDLDAAGRLRASWVAVDPDLDPLRSMARFRQLLAQLPDQDPARGGPS